MAVYLKEYIGSQASAEAVSAVASYKKAKNITEGYSDSELITEGSIMQIIESIHVGPTRNFNWYTEEGLMSSNRSWTEPYQKPLIMHHNEKDGKIIGRVIHSEYVTAQTRSGTPALIHTCNIPDKDGIEQVKDGRLKTVSIGIIAHDVRCSICGKDIEIDNDGDSMCGHLKGNEYEVGKEVKTCYWMIYEMEAKELSYVIVPSDVYAHNLRTYKPTKENIKKYLNESYGGNNNMSYTSIIDLGITESKVIDEDVKKPEVTEVPVVKAVEPKTEPKVEPKTEPKKAEEPVVKDAEPKKAEEPKAEEPKAEEPKAEEPKVKTPEEEIAELKATVKTLEAKVEEAKVKAVELQATLSTEIALKESAENSIISTKVELREALEHSFNSYRVSAGKSIVENLEGRSIDSLRDSILDIKSEMKTADKAVVVTEAVDPTIKEDTKEISKKSKVNVKESNTVSNISVEDALNKVFNLK